MEFLTELWLPILLAAVAVFVASSIFHMLIPIHKSDYQKLDGEDGILEALRAAGVKPGTYMFPACDSMKDMNSPEMKAKYEKGPVGHLTGGLEHGRAAELGRPAGQGAVPDRHLIGVALHELDVVDRQAEMVGRDHRERRGVALTVRHRAGVHPRLPGRVDLDLGHLVAARRGAGRDLHVDRHPDPELHRFTGFAPPRHLQGEPVRRLGHVASTGGPEIRDWFALL